MEILQSLPLWQFQGALIISAHLLDPGVWVEWDKQRALIQNWVVCWISQFSTSVPTRIFWNKLRWNFWNKLNLCINYYIWGWMRGKKYWLKSSVIFFLYPWRLAPLSRIPWRSLKSALIRTRGMFCGVMVEYERNMDRKAEISSGINCFKPCEFPAVGWAHEHVSLCWWVGNGLRGFFCQFQALTVDWYFLAALPWHSGISLLDIFLLVKIFLETWWF